MTFELRASSGDHARILAQHLMGRVYAAVGHPPRELAVAWVAPMSADFASSHRFIDQARELADGGQYELAVVAAQIHVEVQVQTLIRRAVDADVSPFAGAAIAARKSWAPTDRWVKPLLDAARGRPVTTFPLWEQYTKHYSRRNAVAHAGQEMTEDLARASIDVADSLWRWLNTPEQPASQSVSPTLNVSPRAEQLQLFEPS